MDFVRGYFFTNETLGSWTYLSSLLGGFAVAPTQKWWKKCSTAQSFIPKEVTSYKICILINILYFSILFCRSIWRDHVILVRHKWWICEIKVILNRTSISIFQNEIIQTKNFFRSWRSAINRSAVRISSQWRWNKVPVSEQ